MAESSEIDRVRSSVNIVEIVSPYVALKRSGPVWKGCCPFHSEKTPSFIVNPQKGIWYCFGQCSEGGDVFKFLQKKENLTFYEVLERLAQQSGITLTRTAGSKVEPGKRERLYHALEMTTLFYQDTLRDSPNAREYLLKRGIAYETQKTFRLGYAGESFDGLQNYLRRRQILVEDAIDAGVLTKTDRGYDDNYDKMRGRIICPIFDVHDRPVAFGGRLMEPIPDRPKYLNGAETLLFSKGRTFFGMSHARKAIAEKKFAIVVEGYFDVISAHQAGFTNVIATLGTSLTQDHADVLGRYTSRVLLAFDADAAGIKAAERANAILEKRDFEVQVLNLPAGDDPDSILQKGNISGFTLAIDNALPIREFQLRTIMAQHNNGASLNEREKTAIFHREILPLLKSTRSVIEREQYVLIAAPMHPQFERGSTLAEEQIRQEITGRMQSQVYTERLVPYQFSRNGRDRRNPAFKVESGNRKAPVSGLELAQENVLRALIGSDPAIAKLAADNVTPELFVSEPHSELAGRILTGRKFADYDVSDELSGNNNSADMLLAKIMALADGTNDSETDILNRSYWVPLTVEVVSDSISRLRKEADSRIELSLRSRADSGDVTAAQELMQFKRSQHLKRDDLASQVRA